MKSFLTFLGLVLALALSALFIGPRYVDWNSYRDVFELHASNLIGRDVRVGGAVNLKLLPTPYLEFENIQIAREDSSFEQPFAQAEAFRLWLAVPPLLRGVIEAKKVELAKPRFRFEMDEKGRGNWQAIGKSIGPVPFLPNDIALQSVLITDGQFSFTKPSFDKAVEVQNINGDFTATTLAGPYRFKGAFTHAEQQRLLSFSTTQQDAQKAMQFKALLEVPKSSSKYLFDGRITPLTENFSLEAVVKGTMPIDFLHVLETGASSKTSLHTQANEDRSLQVQSNLVASLHAAEFRDAVLTINDTKRPQNVEGSVTLDWKEGVKMTAEARAAWLDFDELLGVKAFLDDLPDGSQSAPDNPKATPVNRLVGLFSKALQDLSMSVKDASIAAQITEAQLGNSLLSDFKVRIEKNNDVFRIQELKTELPGRNKLELSGLLAAEQNTLSFSGPVRMRGSSLGAFTHWAFYQDSTKKRFQPSPYVLQGDVQYALGRFAVRDLLGDLNGSQIKGSLEYDFLAAQRVNLQLDSNEVDLRDILPQGATLRSIAGLFTEAQKPKPASSTDAQTSFKNKISDIFPSQDTNAVTTSFLQNIGEAEATVNLRVGLLKLPTLDMQDFVAKGQLRNNALQLQSLSFLSKEGLALQGSGTLDNISDQSSGNIRFSLKADTEKSVQEVLQQFHVVDPSTRKTSDFHRVLSPLQLAINLNVGDQQSSATNIIVAGSAADSQVSLNLRHEGPLVTFGEKHLDVSGSIKNKNAYALVAQIAQGQTYHDTQTLSDTSGVLNLVASGIPTQGMDTRLQLNAGTTELQYTGQHKLTVTDISGQGQFALSSRDAATGLALLGFRPIEDIRNEPLNVAFDLKKSGYSYELMKVRGTLGRVRLDGQAKISLQEKPMVIDATFSTSQASLPGLLSYILPSEQLPELTQAVGITQNVDNPNWPKGLINTDILSQLRGRLTLRFYRLALADTLTLRDGELHARLDDKALHLEKIKGTLFDGTFQSSAQLAKHQGGLKLTGKLDVKNADLAQVFKTRRNSLARGAGDFSLNFSSQGLSPLGLVAVLKGEGQMTARNGEIFNFAPNALPKTIARFNRTGQPNTSFENIFLQELVTGSFPFQTITAPVKMTGGTLKISEVSAEQQKAKITASFSTDLSRFTMKSNWRIAQTQQGATSSALPAVRMNFTGPISQLDRVEPRIDTSDLQRILSVKRVEQDVETLERLNTRDPEAIRRAQERLEAQPLSISPQYRRDSFEERLPSETDNSRSQDALSPLSNLNPQNINPLDAPPGNQTGDTSSGFFGPPASATSSSSGVFTEGGQSLVPESLPAANWQDPLSSTRQSQQRTRERQSDTQSNASELDGIFSDSN